MSHNKVKKAKTQKESHCEIERKRRERMKLETEYLHRQVPDSQCKDKLSIFLAGAERLIYYTEKLGKRDYIINDDEYSRIIMNNFCGFAILIKCSDGTILSEQNAEKVLGVFEKSILGKTIYELAEPSSNTVQIILNGLSLNNLEFEKVQTGELIPRNIVLGLRCGSEISLKHSVRGSDGKMYRFIEFCGDIFFEDQTLMFRGLCRSLDTACMTINDFGKPMFQSLDQDHITLRLEEKEFLITEVIGNSMRLIGWSVHDLLGKHLDDFSLVSEAKLIKHEIQQAIHNKSSSFKIHWSQPDGLQTVDVFVHLDCIRVNICIHCIVCKLYRVDYSVNEASFTSKGIPSLEFSSNDLDDSASKQTNSYSDCVHSDQAVNINKRSHEILNQTFNPISSNDLDACEENLNEDWPPIHIVPSLDQVLSEIDHPDLFHPDYLKDLIQEDVTDL